MGSPKKALKPGIISVQDLTFECIVGILPHERKTPQPVSVHLELAVDFSEVTHRDQLVSGGVDYSQLCAFIEKTCQTKKFFLLEDMVDQLGQAILNEYPPITKLKLQINKPEALSKAKQVGAAMRFERKSH